MRTMPTAGLHNPEEISKFLSREIEELLNSGEQVCEVTLRGLLGGGEASRMVERVVTLRLDDDGGRTVTVEGLLKNPVRVSIRKSVVGPSQLLIDEIGGTFRSTPF